MAPPVKKQKNLLIQKKLAQLNERDEIDGGPSAEYSDNRSYRKGFKADKKYARRHKAYMFVERGPFNWTKLHFAVWRDDMASVKKYVEYHQTTKPEVLLNKGQWGETALHLALRMQRSPEMIRELLRGRGAEAVKMQLVEYYFKDIDDEDLWYGLCYYPILEAVQYKNHKHALEVTKMMIENGADVDSGDYNDIPPISFAASMGHRDVLQLLVENGAELLKSNCETLVFHMAVSAKKEKDAIDCLKYLFSLDKSYINYQDDRYGNTALHTACKDMKIDVIKFLVKAGADVNIKNKGGKTPLDKAMKNSQSHWTREEAAEKLPQIEKVLKKEELDN